MSEDITSKRVDKGTDIYPALHRPPLLTDIVTVSTMAYRIFQHLQLLTYFRLPLHSARVTFAPLSVLLVPYIRTLSNHIPFPDIGCEYKPHYSFRPVSPNISPFLHTGYN
jgi:hypothetical protein